MLKSPLSIHFEVTNICNNRCSHCYASSWLKENVGPKPELIEIARKIAENNIFDLVITGGEPLLFGVNNLSKLFKFLHKQNIQFSLNTNGRLLSKETCNLLINNGLNGVLVSLHSWINSLHDNIVNIPNAAEDTKNGIRNAIEQGLRVTVNQVISNQNIGVMFESSKELEKIGVNELSFTRLLSPLGVDYKLQMIEANIFLDEYIKCKEKLRIPVKSLVPIPYCADSRVKDLKERLNCTGGLSSAAISCYGDVRFCPQDPKVWGNVFKEDLSSIWERIVKWRSSVAIPVECEECSFLEDCRGGCRVSSKIYKNNYSALDPWACGPDKNYIRKVIYHEFNLNSLHMLMPNIRFRKEKNAFLLYSNNDFLTVNSDGVKFVNCLPNKFIPIEFLEQTKGNKELFKGFLELLYQKGMIIKI